MPFRVITRDDAGEEAREFRSITGARRQANADFIMRAQALAEDESLWAPRTIKLMRGRMQALQTAAIECMRYDGPDSIEADGLHVRIEHDPDAPTAGERKVARAVARSAKWMDARFPGKCGTCGGAIAQGARIFYVPADRKAFCEDPCGRAREVAMRTSALVTP